MLIFTCLLSLFGLVLNIVLAADLLPCPICWYQRGLLLSLAIILTVAVFRKDKTCYRYALPLSLVGIVFAVIKVFDIPEICNKCGEVRSFAEVFLPWAGIIIFTIISICLLVLRKQVIRKSLRK